MLRSGAWRSLAQRASYSGAGGLAWHSSGRGFEGGTWLMHLTTRRSSLFWSQALKKSACMLEAPPEERVTLPEGFAWAAHLAVD